MTPIRITATVPVIQRDGVLARNGFLVPLSVMDAPPDRSTAFLVIENGAKPITLEVSIEQLRHAIAAVETESA